MTKAGAGAIATGLLVAALTGGVPAQARGHHTGGLFGHVHHGHPINAWMGTRRVRFR